MYLEEYLIKKGNRIRLTTDWHMPNSYGTVIRKGALGTIISNKGKGIFFPCIYTNICSNGSIGIESYKLPYGNLVVEKLPKDSQFYKDHFFAYPFMMEETKRIKLAIRLTKLIKAKYKLCI